MVIFENSEHFIRNLLFEILADTPLNIKFAIFGSQDQGWPVRRCRLYAFCFNREKLVWTGPQQMDVLDNFLMWFGRSVCMEADNFIGIDTDAAYESHLRSFALRRGMYATPEQLSSCREDWVPLLPRAMALTHQAGQDVFERGHRTGLGGSFVLDLSQSVERLRCGPWIPTVARSTCLCSLSKRRLVTPSEIEFAMGWPSITTHESARYADALGYETSFSSSSQKARLSFAGNGMMMPQIMAFFLYSFSHLIRRDVLEFLEVPLRLTAMDSDADSTSEGGEPIEASMT